MNKDISIRLISTDDVEELRTVALQAYRDHYLHLWYDGGEWYIGKSFSISRLSNELADANARFYIIYLADAAVGFLKLNIDAPLEGLPHLNALELERIYLTGAASGKGVGSAALDLVFGLAAELNKDTVWLKVMNSSHGPIAFYKKHGFAECGTHQLDFEMMKKELRGMYVMKKELG